MKITIEFDSNNPDELDTVLAALSASPVGKDVAPAETKAEEPDTSEADAAAEKKKADAAAKKKADDKKKADAAAKKKADEEAAAAKAAEEAEAEEGGGDDAGSEFTRDDVRAKLKEHAALEGKEAAIQILKDNGAASITELAEDKFADVIEACG